MAAYLVILQNRYDATDDEAAKLGTFATAPAIRNYPMVLVSKLVATIIVFIIICFTSTDGNAGNN